MELRQLNYFITVAKTLNFSEASRRLYVSQSAVSQQIKLLEEEMGISLFDRTAHRVNLTEAGEELLPLAIQTIESSKVCKHKMLDLKDVLTGTLNLGTTHSFSGLMLETVKNFVKKYPGVNLNIYSKTASELFDMLRDKVIDLALAFKPVMAYDDIESEELFKTNLCLVVKRSHILACRDNISLDELENQKLVLPGRGLQARRIFDRFVGLDTRKLDVRVEIDDPELIMTIVEGTNLVTMLSPLAAYYHKELIAIPLDNGKYSMTGCVHRLSEGYKKRSVDVFIDMLRESAQIERLLKNLAF